MVTTARYDPAANVDGGPSPPAALVNDANNGGEGNTSVQAGVLSVISNAAKSSLRAYFEGVSWPLNKALPKGLSSLLVRLGISSGSRRGHHPGRCSMPQVPFFRCDMGRAGDEAMVEYGSQPIWIMERIANEHRRAHFCQFPIDMYISKLGPWYSTRREIDGHSGAGRVGSTT